MSFMKLSKHFRYNWFSLKKISFHRIFSLNARMCFLIRKTSSFRFITFAINNHNSNFHSLNAGFPQGWVLGPTLFLSSTSNQSCSHLRSWQHSQCWYPISSIAGICSILYSRTYNSFCIRTTGMLCHILLDSIQRRTIWAITNNPLLSVKLSSLGYNCVVGYIFLFYRYFRRYIRTNLPLLFHHLQLIQTLYKRGGQQFTSFHCPLLVCYPVSKTYKPCMCFPLILFIFTHSPIL